MRVADRSTTRNYLKQLNGAKNDYAKTANQIYTGNRFTQLSDDVSAGTRVLRTRMDQNKSLTHLGNVESVNSELTVAEDNMTSINDILAQVHSLAVKASNEPNGEIGLESIANEIKNLKEELLVFANAKYGEKYLFGGSNASFQAPFAEDDDGRLTYNGIPVDDIQQKTDGSYFYNKEMDDGTFEETPIPMDEDVYMDIGLGIKMTESQIDGDSGFLISCSGLDFLGFGTDPETGLSNNIFNVIKDLEESVREEDTELIGKLSTQLTTRTDSFRANLTDMGSKTKFLSTMQTRLENTVDNQQVRINQLMGTDDVEAATTLMMNDAVLKAVQQMGAQVLPVSLMDFLR